MNLKYTYYSYR